MYADRIGVSEKMAAKDDILKVEFIQNDWGLIENGLIFQNDMRIETFLFIIRW